MLVVNETEIPLLYVVSGGGVVTGVLLPGQRRDLGGERAESISFSTDDGTPLPATLSIRLVREEALRPAG